jgi:hypothetical protein
MVCHNRCSHRLGWSTWPVGDNLGKTIDEENAAARGNIDDWKDTTIVMITRIAIVIMVVVKNRGVTRVWVRVSSQRRL